MKGLQKLAREDTYSSPIEITTQTVICDFVICAELTGLSVKTGITNGLGQQFYNGQ